MLYEFLGKNIRQSRLKLNLTQDQLAEKVDISTSYMGRIERGERSLPLDTLIRISNVLNVSVDTLLQDSINIDNDILIIAQINQLISKLNTSDKKLIIDMINLMISHLNRN